MHRRSLVLMGDSILFHWPVDQLPVATGLPILNRAVPGEQTTQMLLRFQDDVIAHHPAAVVILGGTNDMRVDAGDLQVERNIAAMVDIAQAHDVPVVLCAIPPVGPGRGLATRDPATIARVNDWLRRFAADRDLSFADVHAALCDAAGQLRPGLGQADGIHLTPDGYRAMAPILGAALMHLGLWAPAGAAA